MRLVRDLPERRERLLDVLEVVALHRKGSAAYGEDWRRAMSHASQPIAAMASDPGLAGGQPTHGGSSVDPMVIG